MNNKKIGNIYASLTLLSVLAFSLIVSPLASMAKEKEKNRENESENRNEKSTQNIGSPVNSTLSNFDDRIRSNSNKSKEKYKFESENGKFKQEYENESEDDNDDDNNGSGTTSIPRNLPPSISGITAPTILTVGQTGTWTVNASDPENGTLSYSVDWGDTVNLLRAMMMTSSAFVQTTESSHSYSAPGTYRILFTVMDDVGQTNSSSVTVRVRNVPNSTSTLVISDIVASSTRPRQAKIAWTTNNRSDTAVWYGTTSPVMTTGDPSIYRPNNVLKHNITLTRLVPGTKYFLIVGSTDRNGNVQKSSELSFTTPTLATTTPPIPIDIIAPIISTSSLSVASSTIEVAWMTNEPATSKVYYSTTTPINIRTSTTPFIVNSSLTTNHSILLNGLATSTQYYMVIESADASNNIATSTELTAITDNL